MCTKKYTTVRAAVLENELINTFCSDPLTVQNPAAPWSQFNAGVDILLNFCYSNTLVWFFFLYTWCDC